MSELFDFIPKRRNGNTIESIVNVMCISLFNLLFDKEEKTDSLDSDRIPRIPVGFPWYSKDSSSRNP